MLASVLCFVLVCVVQSVWKEEKAEETGVESRMRENLLIYEIEAAAEQTEYDFKHKMMYRHFQGQYFEK